MKTRIVKEYISGVYKYFVDISKEKDAWKNHSVEQNYDDALKTVEKVKAGEINDSTNQT